MVALFESATGSERFVRNPSASTQIYPSRREKYDILEGMADEMVSRRRLRLATRIDHLELFGVCPRNITRLDDNHRHEEVLVCGCTDCGSSIWREHAGVRSRRESDPRLRCSW